MSIDNPFHGSLFANDFICESIVGTPDWKVLDDSGLDALEASARDIFNVFPIAGSPNESQTEDDLIWPVLTQLGWTASLRQQNLSAHGREDVPDGLLFQDAAAKDRANAFTEEWKRYEFGLAVVESKRWGRPLDRRSGRRGEETAPSTQMLRYLRRVDDLTTGQLRWGLLTNGARWGGSITKEPGPSLSSSLKSTSRRFSISPRSNSAKTATIAAMARVGRPGQKRWRREDLSCFQVVYKWWREGLEATDLEGA